MHHCLARLIRSPTFASIRPPIQAMPGRQHPRFSPIRCRRLWWMQKWHWDIPGRKVPVPYKLSYRTILRCDFHRLDVARHPGTMTLQLPPPRSPGIVTRMLFVHRALPWPSCVTFADGIGAGCVCARSNKISLGAVTAQVSRRQVASAQAYILFYTRRRPELALAAPSSPALPPPTVLGGSGHSRSGIIRGSVDRPDVDHVGEGVPA